MNRRTGVTGDTNKRLAQDAATRLLFNDMLGSTVAVVDVDTLAMGGGNSMNNVSAASGESDILTADAPEDPAVTLTGLTLFGEGGKETDFFTGKPKVDELGYSFLFRNYRPEANKWQTADPLGYPDGMNNFAYCGNKPCTVFDSLGLSEQYAAIGFSNFKGTGSFELNYETYHEFGSLGSYDYTYNGVDTSGTYTIDNALIAVGDLALVALHTEASTRIIHDALAIGSRNGALTL